MVPEKACRDEIHSTSDLVLDSEGPLNFWDQRDSSKSGYGWSL